MLPGRQEWWMIPCQVVQHSSTCTTLCYALLYVVWCTSYWSVPYYCSRYIRGKRQMPQRKDLQRNNLKVNSIQFDWNGSDPWMKQFEITIKWNGSYPRMNEWMNPLNPLDESTNKVNPIGMRVWVVWLVINNMPFLIINLSFLFFYLEIIRV